MAIARCCFCGCNSSAVANMVVHPGASTAICDQCVMRCVEVLATGREEPEPEYRLTPAGQGFLAQIEGGAHVV